ncbi:hypothetical protein [Rubrivirga sp. IMCC43871]|uniref:hypothetical protein n=1 Tax=Rubrivirga sp. IMCC43871 TaxID=3391575 RepID=UPI00399030BC
MVRLLALALFSLASSVEAQVCEGDLLLRTQAEVDAVSCTEVTGNLQITEAAGTADPITSLRPLTTVSTVGESLSIYNTTALETLDGLENVAADGYVNVRSNAALRSLGNLPGIVSSSGIVAIEGNAVLDDIAGLAGLRSAGFIVVEDNPALRSLAGLAGIDTLSALHIRNNESLETLGDHWALTAVTSPVSFRGLYIEGNPALADLDVLTDLHSVESTFRLRGNESLVDVDGLSSLRTVGRLEIRDNAALEQIDGLASLQGAEDIIIQGNPVLRTVDGLASLTGVDVLIIGDNPVLASLDGLGGVTWARVVIVTGSDVLENLEGLGLLDGLETLRIEDNARLADIGSLAGSSLDGDRTSISIQRNPALTSLAALAGVGPVVRSVYVWDNDTLESLEGLEGIEAAFRLEVVGNERLADLDALLGLHEVVSLIVRDNAALPDLDGLAGLTDLAGVGVEVSGNGSLVDLAGLRGIHDMAALTLADNDALEHVDGLSSLTAVRHKLTIEGNASLRNLDGLAPLSYIGGLLTVTENPALSSCSCGLYGNLSQGTAFGGVVIRDNAPGCNAEAEISEPAGACAFPIDREDAGAAGAALSVGPNPAATLATARFGVTAPTAARLAVLDARGRLIRVLLDGPVSGAVEAVIATGGLTPGVYFARLTVEGAPPQTAPFVVVR